MNQGSNCGIVQNSTSGAASGRASVAVNQIANTRERGRTLRHLFFMAVFALVISSGFSAMAQVGSTDRDSPLRITTRTVTAEVSRPLGEEQEVFYSIAARRGYMTIDFSALARDGMNIVLGVEGNGVFESIGPLISGGDDRMEGTVRFRVPSRQALLVNVRYSGNARYTINFSGSAIPSPRR
ncbi:MAG TPA: hypothetical protein VF240_04980 [Pyrinomonadaceae bacterium]